MEKRLKVSLNGISVGLLEKDRHGGLHFSYESSWLDTPGARPLSLSIPLSHQRFSGNTIYNFFDNLLPDNTSIRQRVQKQFKIATSSPFDLLAVIGKDCVGAIQLSQDVPQSVKSICYESLTEAEVASTLRGYLNAPLGMHGESEDFRISLAGAQEKTAFLKTGQGWARPLGASPTTHIFKLPIGFISAQNIDLTGSCENEWVCLQLAKAFGFRVPDASIEHFEDQKVLVVERFDRKLSSDQQWIMRLPQEDFCQAMGYSAAKKYQSDGGPGIKECLQLLKGSSHTKDSSDFMRLQVFFWLLAAIDGHAKNFSLYLKSHNRYCMTPLYDVLSAYPLMEQGSLPRQKIKMAMSLKGKNTHWRWNQIQPRHFLSTAKHVGFEVSHMKEQMAFLWDHLDSAVTAVQDQLPSCISEHLVAPIFDGVQKMKSRKLIELG